MLTDGVVKTRDGIGAYGSNVFCSLNGEVTDGITTDFVLIVMVWLSICSVAFTAPPKTGLEDDLSIYHYCDVVFSFRAYSKEINFAPDS